MKSKKAVTKMLSSDSFTISNLSKQLDAGKVSPIELTERAIEATKRYQPSVNAYITFTPEQAMRDAEAIARDIRVSGRKGPLHGIPYAVKDLIFAKGLPATAGSKQMKDFVPDFDADCVAAMKKAGAILMGKTNTQEWGCGPAGDQSYFGAVRNPWDTARISGGSSSGSAAAVATGMVPCAIGSDAGGSIRIPAALCSVVGFKPSFGLVSSKGTFSGSIHLGSIGPMTSTVEDAAIMLDVISAPNPPIYAGSLSELSSLKGVRFAVPTNLFEDCIEPGVLAAFNTLLDTLRRAGADVAEVPIPWLADIPTLSCAITFPEIAYLHRQRLLDDPEGYQPAIKARIERGFTFPAVEYIEAMQRREELKRIWTDFMKDWSAVLMPTEPITAYPLFETVHRINGREEDSSALLVRHTRAANVIGCPALSIPAGLSDGLPVGAMLMGGIGEDAKTLAIGHQIERIYPFPVFGK